MKFKIYKSRLGKGLVRVRGRSDDGLVVRLISGARQVNIRCMSGARQVNVSSQSELYIGGRETCSEQERGEQGKV